MATGRLVPSTRPTATVPEAARAIAEAYERLFGRLPTQAELIILAAQSSHETAEWTAMPGYNVAGLKASLSGPHDYTELLTTEYLAQPDGSQKAVRIVQRFRSYPSLEAGVYDWLSLLARGYPEAIEAARRGDLEGFVRGLQRGWGRGAKYFTSPFDAYLKAVRVRAEQISHWPIAWADIVGPGPSGEAGGLGDG